MVSSAEAAPEPRAGWARDGFGAWASRTARGGSVRRSNAHRFDRLDRVAVPGPARGDRASLPRVLTTDLVRARVVKGDVRPAYIDAADPALTELAATLVALFSAHVGKPRGALDDALTELIGEETDYLLHRGLAKLLEDRAQFGTDSPVDPIVLRQRVFERAARSNPVSRAEGDPVHPVSRAAVLTEVGTELSLSLAQVERALYADLQREQLMLSFEALAPSALLHRYNLSLAQAVLLRAASIEITLAPGDPQRYRQLFRYIKFYRLLYAVSGTGALGYTITLDGPGSLFQLGAKYGVQMAGFLPALLLCDGWRLRADLLWGKDRRRLGFSLEAGSGLRTHYPDKGVYVTDEEAHFVRRFAEVARGWTLERRPEILDLDGRGVVVPDFIVTHEDGREAMLEIVGFWRRGYLAARGELLALHGPRNLVLAVSQRLRASEDSLESLPCPVVFFKDVIPVKDILARCEQVAMAPPGGALRGPRESAPKAPPKAPARGRASKRAAKETESTAREGESIATAPKAPARGRASKRAAKESDNTANETEALADESVTARASRGRRSTSSPNAPAERG